MKLKNDESADLANAFLRLISLRSIEPMFKIKTLPSGLDVVVDGVRRKKFALLILLIFIDLLFCKIIFFTRKLEAITVRENSNFNIPWFMFNANETKCGTDIIT